MNFNQAIPIAQMLDRDLFKAIAALRDCEQHLKTLGAPENAQVMHRFAEYLTNAQVAYSRAMASEFRVNATSGRAFLFPMELEIEALQANRKQDEKENENA